jgi:LemA protein
MPVIITVVVLAAIALWLVLGYNRLVRLRNRTQNAWSQVDVQLKRRYDLVPNLVETVKGYATHEQSTFQAVVEARNAAQAATTVGGQAAAESMLTGALRQLFALAEAYPDLKASDNFRHLQTQLAEVEGDITVARQIYNDTTLTYNNAVETIPTNIIASLTGFQRGEFFEVEDEGRSVPKVEF